MKHLIFDTETTGYPSTSKPWTDDSQPHIIQLAAVLYDHSDLPDFVPAPTHHWERIIKCPIEVPEGAFAVHGISQAKSQDFGLPLAEVLKQFASLLTQSACTVCHNATFDLRMLRIAIARAGRFGPPELSSMLSSRHRICTMKTLSAHNKKLGGPARWPKLDAAYRKHVNPAGFADAHDAMADTKACLELLKFILREKIPPHYVQD